MAVYLLYGIQELYKRIEALELEKKQRNQIPAKKRKNRKRTVVKDKDGTIIQVGDWVIATTPGKFVHTEGKVVGWKKWVTFTDVSGVKQVRAPENLLITNDTRKPAGTHYVRAERK